MKDRIPKTNRTAERTAREHLNSPVNDPGYWPYDQLSGGLPETVTGIEEPDDPACLVPPYRRSRKESED